MPAPEAYGIYGKDRQDLIQTTLSPIVAVHANWPAHGRSVIMNRQTNQPVRTKPQPCSPRLRLPVLAAVPTGCESKNLQILYRVGRLRDGVGAPQLQAIHVW